RPDDDHYGDISLINTGASSCSEMVVDLVNKSEGQLVLNQKAARMLYAGIAGDTGRFMYDNTTAHTLRVTAQLFEFDINASEMNRKMDDISQGVPKLSAYVWDNMVITEHNTAYIVLKHDLVKSFDLGAQGTDRKSTRLNSSHVS